MIRDTHTHTRCHGLAAQFHGTDAAFTPGLYTGPVSLALQWPWDPWVSLQAQGEARMGVTSTREGQGAAQPMFLTSAAAVGRDLPSPGCTSADHKGAAVKCEYFPVFPTLFIQKLPINHGIIGWFGLERPLQPILFPSPALGRGTSH